MTEKDAKELLAHLHKRVEEDFPTLSMVKCAAVVDVMAENDIQRAGGRNCLSMALAVVEQHLLSLIDGAYESFTMNAGEEKKEDPPNFYD